MLVHLEVSNSITPGSCLLVLRRLWTKCLGIVPILAGSYDLDLTAMVVNLASVGLDADLSFPIPYNGENAILNTVLGTDYSALNSFVPTFTQC